MYVAFIYVYIYIYIVRIVIIQVDVDAKAVSTSAPDVSHLSFAKIESTYFNICANMIPIRLILFVQLTL